MSRGSGGRSAMDSRRFDTLTKSLSSTGTRRSIARLVAVLPLGVALTALLGTGQDTTAKDDDHGSSHRRHRRKAEHRHQTGNNKENRKGKRKGKGKGKGTDTGTGTGGGTGPVQYCHAITAEGGACPTTATQF